MKKCPHCQFLVREDTRTCGVCHKPLFQDVGVPAFAAGQRRGQETLAAHVGPAESGFPLSLVWLLVVGLLFAVAIWLTSAYWL